MDLLKRNSRFNQRERIFDFGSKETFINAKDLRKSLQQIRRNQKRPITNDGTKI